MEWDVFHQPGYLQFSIENHKARIQPERINLPSWPSRCIASLALERDPLNVHCYSVFFTLLWLTRFRVPISNRGTSIPVGFKFLITDFSQALPSSGENIGWAMTKSVIVCWKQTVARSLRWSLWIGWAVSTSSAQVQWGWPKANHVWKVCLYSEVLHQH